MDPARTWPWDLIPIWHCIPASLTQTRIDQRCRWSEAVLWACQDLNLGPHPYQLSRAKRHANRRFPRSLASGRRSVITAVIKQGEVIFTFPLVIDPSPHTV
jgi:hypothetical protein